MFVASPSVELRQGDVCTVPFFPVWTVDSSAYLPPEGPPLVAVKDAWRILECEAGKLVSVCSYDCDLENPRDRSGILLAPL